MAYSGLEALGPAIARIKASIEGRIGQADMEVMPAVPADHSSPPRGPESAFIEYVGPRGRRTETGNRLLFAAQCDEPAWWERVDRAFADEGFTPFGPRTQSGVQVYQSTRWASLIVEEHPGATMAIERTGKAMVGRIKGA
jgi:hypothetical protein